MVTPLDPDAFNAAVIEAVTEANLRKRGELDTIGRLHDPTAVVRVERDDEDHVLVHLDGRVVCRIPPAALENAVRLIREAEARRGRLN